MIKTHNLIALILIDFISWRRLYTCNMNDQLNPQKKTRVFALLEILCIVLLAIVPLFMTFPYRVNIFLSWEGAYRMSQGQIPYKDFGMPLGYMYWVIPAVFFKIFGTQLITLVKAQVFINILSGFTFRSILKSLDVHPGVRLLSVVLYCISFSFFNFWPWYNHTVIVYEMIGLAFLMFYIFRNKKWIWLCLSAFFIFCSFFTKQDSGGLALLLALVLLVYYCFYEKQWRPLVIFITSYVIVALAIILTITRYNFGYWFNHGQPPHTSRFSAFDIIDDFFSYSQWIKFYLLIIAFLTIAYFKSWKSFFTDKKAAIFLLLTLGILAEASILQVTSYTPPDNNIFFHSFAFAFILSFLIIFLKIDLMRLRPLMLGLVTMLLWWSGVFWKYIQRIAERTLSTRNVSASTTENLITKDTYVIKPETSEIPMSEWTFSGLKSFQKIYMPKPTADGIKRLLESDLVRGNKNLKILNMTELTPLAVEMPYKMETGPEIPLWFHLGVSMFNKHAVSYEKKIIQKQYDLVLFEYIPSLNNFYPFRVRDTLRNHYTLVDSFMAPRRGDTQGIIEVYRK